MQVLKTNAVFWAHLAKLSRYSWFLSDVWHCYCLDGDNKHFVLWVFFHWGKNSCNHTHLLCFEFFFLCWYKVKCNYLSCVKTYKILKQQIPLGFVRPKGENWYLSIVFWYLFLTSHWKTGKNVCRSENPMNGHRWQGLCHKQMWLKGEDVCAHIFRTVTRKVDCITFGTVH